MDWVHCNNCYVQPGDTDSKKFFITNCGHIYCDECLKLNKSNECQLCHTKYSTIPLTAKMNSEIEIYFHDPAINLKKQLKILEFQKSHRTRLVSYTKEKIKNYKILKKENTNLNEELKLSKNENATLREEIKRLKVEFYEFRKKYEVDGDVMRSSQKIPQINSFSHFLTADAQKNIKTKNFSLRGDESSERSFNQSLKRLANPDFFLMTESLPSDKNKKSFTTPHLPRFPGTYRSQKMSTPDMSTPSTPETLLRDLSQKDPLQRKVNLPPSRSGPSPATRIKFHGLNLSRPTSTPYREKLVTNKYSKYFN